MALKRPRLVLRNRQLEQDKTILQSILQCLMNDEQQDGVAFVNEPGTDATWTLSLYRSTAPHGGIVVVTYDHPGQAAHSAAYYFENYSAVVSRVSTKIGCALRAAVGELYVRRQQLLDAA